jgi:hypothetical protein
MELKLTDYSLPVNKKITNFKAKLQTLPYFFSKLGVKAYMNHIIVINTTKKITANDKKNNIYHDVGIILERNVNIGTMPNIDV